MICSKRPIGGSARQPAETQGDASLKRSGELEPAPVTAGLVQEIWHLQIRQVRFGPPAAVAVGDCGRQVLAGRPGLDPLPGGAVPVHHHRAHVAGIGRDPGFNEDVLVREGPDRRDRHEPMGGRRRQRRAQGRDFSPCRAVQIAQRERWPRGRLSVCDKLLFEMRQDHLSVTLVRPRKHLRGTRPGRFAVEGCDERLFAQLNLSEAGRPEVESAMASPTARRFGSWQPIRAAHLDGALYSGVCAHLGSGPLTWQETEANLDVETARHRDSASSQVSAAEDARFELARGCPQHAFQACALGH
jgi:hypothetical protein